MTLPAIVSLRTGRVSRLPFHFRGERFDLTALGGQVATFARAATAAPLDSSGVARTVNHTQPAWQVEDWDGDATRETPALLLGTSDTIWWPMLALPIAMTLYLEFVQAGAIGAASKTICYLGNSGNTGARFWVDSTGSFYRINHNNGSTAVTSTLGAAPTNGQRVAIRATLGSDGKVQIFQSINGAAETNGTLSGTNTLAAAWSDTRLYGNSTGATNIAAISLIRSRLILGARTAAQAAVDW